MPEVNGYDLFVEVDDPQLQARNRAVCLYNIFEENANKGKITAGSVAQMVDYMKSIPTLERATVVEKLHLMMNGGGNG